MELGESFFEPEEDIVQDIKAIAIPKYTPKYCSQEWFCECNEDNNDDVLKYRADLYYYKKEYTTALRLYERLIQVLPPTHSQLKREITDSIVRCCIQCGLVEQGLAYCRILVALPHDKDHSSWRLMLMCHRLSTNDGHFEDEVLCSLKCVLFARHFPVYWLELHNAYIRLSTSTTSFINTDILDHTHQLLRPYFNKQDATSSTHPHYQLFIGYLTTPTSLMIKTCNDYLIFLNVASLCVILRAQLLTGFTLSRSSSLETKSSCQQLQDTIQTVLQTYTDNILKEIVIKHMQTPSEIDI